MGAVLLGPEAALASVVSVGWRKRLTRLAIALAIAGLLSAAALVFWPVPADKHQQTGVTEENFLHICRSMHRGSTTGGWYEGMRSQAEAVLGPPGDYRTRPVIFDPPSCPGRYPPGTPRTVLVWQTDMVEIHVIVDPRGTVLGMGSSTQVISQPGEWDRFHWDLKRRWHRWFP
jgi:hypothetical protein